MDSYILVNWRSRLALSDGTFVSLKVDNVMDEEYQEFPQYAQPGRTFLAGLEVSF
jgi:outer membrane cobalamin receptor